MSVLGGDDSFQCGIELSKEEQAAWKLYCEETDGDMDVRDYWWDLPDLVQELYLARV